jgi:hypothetical protein
VTNQIFIKNNFPSKLKAKYVMKWCLKYKRNNFISKRLFGVFMAVNQPKLANSRRKEYSLLIYSVQDGKIPFIGEVINMDELFKKCKDRKYNTKYGANISII